MAVRFTFWLYKQFTIIENCDIMSNMILVKDKRKGKIVPILDELEEDTLTPQEVEELNYLADPRFFGPDYDE